jgi:hypothetical protein
MLGFGAIGQFAIGQGPSAAAEIIFADKWFVALSEPPRFPVGLKASAQQFAGLTDPFPFVTFGYFADLTIPATRTRLRLQPGQEQFAAADTAVIPVSRLTPWFTALSEPPRFKIGLKPPEQQFGAADTTVIPISKLSPWFTALSEPPRFRIGLKPPEQQFIAWPPQLRPTPTSFVVLNALETKDGFLGALMEWAQVTSGEVGVVLANTPTAEIGAGVEPISGAQVSIFSR